MSLAIYRWEHRQWPWQYAVKIRPSLRVALTQELARAWGLTKGSIPVSLTTRGGGRAHLSTWGCSISLPSDNYPCSLGLIVHELAHVCDWVRNKHSGHTAPFKSVLIKLMVEVRALRMLPPILDRLRQEDSRAMVRCQKVILVAQERARRAQEARERAQSPRGRLDRVRDLVRRLQQRQKRVERALAKARRRESALKRSVERQNGVTGAENALFQPAATPFQPSMPSE